MYCKGHQIMFSWMWFSVLCVWFVCACAATPAPADKLEKNGKEGEKEDKEEGEAPSEKAKEKDKDEGKEVDGSKAADPEEVGHVSQNKIL